MDMSMLEQIMPEDRLPRGMNKAADFSLINEQGR